MEIAKIRGIDKPALRKLPTPTTPKDNDTGAFQTDSSQNNFYSPQGQYLGTLITPIQGYPTK